MVVCLGWDVDVSDLRCMLSTKCPGGGQPRESPGWIPDDCAEPANAVLDCFLGLPSGARLTLRPKNPVPRSAPDVRGRAGAKTELRPKSLVPRCAPLATGMGMGM